MFQFQALKKTRNRLSDVLSVPREINPEFLEDLESSLIVADIGAETTDEIIQSLTLSMNRNELKDSEAVKMALRNLLLERLLALVSSLPLFHYFLKLLKCSEYLLNRRMQRIM